MIVGAAARRPVLRAGVLAALLLLGNAATPPSQACGNEGLLGDAVSAAHPSSIDVALAIRDAFDARRITPLQPLPLQQAEARTDKLVQQMERAWGVPLALLLVESRHWSRHATSVGDKSMHAEGPQPGDAVLVTGEVVLRELLDGRLGWLEAQQRGLVVLAGEESSVAALSTRLAQRFPKATRPS